jgi:phosphoribosyl-ATP pyrophosphohydrolase
MRDRRRGNNMPAFTLSDLAKIIESRTSAKAEKSYTKSLLDAGMQRCVKKFGEEAVEAVIAGMEGNRENLRNEAADVLYHLLVVLQAGGVPLQDVMDELQRRTAQSGIDEKAARAQ